MTQTYYTILTNVGAASLANAHALGQSLQLTTFSVGDGAGESYSADVEMLKASTGLINPVYTGAINELKVDPENPARYFAEGVVPVEVGGWTVREVGWFLSDGALFAITNFPPTYKTIPADGAAVELPIRTYIATGSTDAVELKIDPTVVLATRNYVDASITASATDDFAGQSSGLLASQKAVHDAHADALTKLADIELFTLAAI